MRFRVEIVTKDVCGEEIDRRALGDYDTEREVSAAVKAENDRASDQERRGRHVEVFRIDV